MKFYIDEKKIHMKTKNIARLSRLACGGCTCGTATVQTLGRVRSRPMTEEEGLQNIPPNQTKPRCVSIMSYVVHLFVRNRS